MDHCLIVNDLVSTMGHSRTAIGNACQFGVVCQLKLNKERINYTGCPENVYRFVKL